MARSFWCSWLGFWGLAPIVAPAKTRRCVTPRKLAKFRFLQRADSPPYLGIDLKVRRSFTPTRRSPTCRKSQKRCFQSCEPRKRVFLQHHNLGFPNPFCHSLRTIPFRPVSSSSRQAQIRAIEEHIRRCQRVRSNAQPHQQLRKGRVRIHRMAQFRPTHNRLLTSEF